MFQVHEYTVDRAKGVARIGSTNPARTYVLGERDADGVLQVKYTTVQIKGGELYYFDEGGVAIEGTDVPDYILKDLARNPVRRGSEKIEQVIKFCQYCPAPDNVYGSEVFEAHLVKHLVALGATPVKPEDSTKGKKKQAA